ncbi:LAMI_0C05798g1_1 [Lachancea mirantina]|uniref:LAMI_0C05798g1_1 n=1 Tax=Lachancea mirantina TaxID=1230905 RepID=A0A1G4J309_9SACH|nr:LAMI_0C05798g1_1 [Lachancea mirantina]
MNSLYLKWRLGQLDDVRFRQVVVDSELQKLQEASPVAYSHRRATLPIGVTCLALDSQGQTLLSTGEDGSVALWGLDEASSQGDLCNKRLNFIRGDIGEKEEDLSRFHIVPRASETSANGRSPKFRSSVVSARTNSQMHAASAHDRQRFHKHSISSVQWYAADNGLFFTGSSDHSLKIWDTNSFEVVHSFDVEYRISQIDTRDDLIAVASENSHPRLVDLKSMSAAITLGVRTKGMRSGINTAKFSRGSQLLVATGDDSGQVRVWDLRKSNQVVCDVIEQDSMVKPHAQCCNDICWNPEGNSQLITTGNDGKCKLWSILSGRSRLERQLGTTDPHRNRFRRRTSQYLMWHDRYVFWNSDYGEILVLQSDDGKLRGSFDYPLGGTQKVVSPRFQSMALQSNLSNGLGMRLFAGTDHHHGKILEFKV